MKEQTSMNDYGETEIDWLTEGDRQLISFFDQVHSRSGMWRNKRSVQWMYFWLFQMTMFVTIYFYSLYFFLLSSELEILAHLIHHIIMALDDFMYIYLLTHNRRNLEIVHELGSTTYNYESEIVKDYHKQLMTDRLKTHRFIAKFVVLSAMATLLYLEAFYLLEATFLKSYVTMFPIYLPIDLSHPVTYTCVVFLQHLQVYVTIVMCSGLIAVLFTAWSHITMELDTLTFAMSHVDDMVKEKLLSLSYKNGIEKETARAKVYHSCCHHFARHHAAILRYFYAFKKSSAVTITCIYLTGVICFACAGITAVTDNLGIKLKFFFIMVLQTAIVYSWCWVGQQLGDKNANLQDVIAGIPWWNMPKSCHSTLLLIMVGSSRPLVISTPLGQVANNENFMDMASSSYRIFNLIYQMKFSS